MFKKYYLLHNIIKKKELIHKLITILLIKNIHFFVIY